MKFTLLLAFALIGCAAAAQLPDSATQGPNPQDIATPEPEYIDIDEPPPAPAPAPIQARSSFVAAPRPIQRPIAPISIGRAPSQSYLPPQRGGAQLPGHSFSQQSGYQYRRPVFVRRVYRRRF